MKKFLLVFLFLFCGFLGYIFGNLPFAYSDELDDINKKMSDLQSALDSSKKATVPLESQVNNLKTQLTGIENRVAFLTEDIAKKKKVITQSYKDLEKQQDILHKAIRNHYVNSFSYSPLLVLLSSEGAGDLTRSLVYQKRGADQDKAIIASTALKITDLEERKVKLEDEEKRLASVKAKLAVEKKEIEKIVLGAKQYQQTLSKQIAELSQKQQQLIAQKQSSLNLPRSASIGSGCIDDRPIDPGFSPRFAFFTYGIPHRVGMSQYGAYGRAKAGQDYRAILNAYFNNVRFECRSFSKIRVQGYGEKSIGDYLKGLGEMPESWGNSGGYEALKAQVVAAASYAYTHTNGGSGEICTTQSCQVYLGHNKGGKWDQAVDDIKNKCGDGIELMVSNDTNEVITAWYASTFGGYTFNSGDVFGGSKPWTKRSQDASGSIDSFSSLNEKAYDKESPYFYCDWGARKEYKSTAWLKSDEVADIVNVILLARKDSSTTKHLSQTDKPNPDGVATWDKEKVKQELRNRGETPMNSVSDVSIDWDKGVGTTTSIRFSGDGGSHSFSGSEFKNFFNVRAPSNIQIVGPLYNVEKR